MPGFRPPSFSLALAGLWRSLIELGTCLTLLGLGVAIWAPRQDLPWTPLRLEDPPGLATRWKFAAAVRKPALCRQVLRSGGVTFTEEPPRRDGVCTTSDAVRLRSGVTPLAPAAPVMTCREALAYAFWDRHAVQPAARQLLQTAVTRVEHFGTYACRNIYSRAEAPPSQHASANALDVAGFRTARGERLTIARGFRAAGAEGVFLRSVRSGACPWFSAVLSPDYNAAHADHLHLDQGPWRACR